MRQNYILLEHWCRHGAQTTSRECIFYLKNLSSVKTYTNKEERRSRDVVVEIIRRRCQHSIVLGYFVKMILLLTGELLHIVE
jgi:hypothetical protein